VIIVHVADALQNWCLRRAANGISFFSFTGPFGFSRP
jgi:hypothetical protein